MKKIVLILMASLFLGIFAVQGQGIISTGADKITVLPGAIFAIPGGIKMTGTGNSTLLIPNGTALENSAPNSRRILMNNPNAAYDVTDVAVNATANFFITVNAYGATPLAQIDVVNKGTSAGDYSTSVSTDDIPVFNDLPVQWTLTKSTATTNDQHTLVFTWENALEPTLLPLKGLFVYNAGTSAWEELDGSKMVVDDVNHTLTYSYTGVLNGTKFMIAQRKPKILVTSAVPFTDITWCPEYASNAQSFQIYATGLTNPMMVKAPKNFEISLAQDGTYVSSLTFNPGNGDVPTIIKGDVPTTTLWIRIPANATASSSVATPIVSSTTDPYYTVADVNLNITSIPDITPPTIVAANKTMYLDENGSLVITPSDLDLGSTDNCNIDLFITPSTFSCNNVGKNSVLMIATDKSSNTSFKTITLTVLDVIPPTIIEPAAITVAANESCQAVIANLGTPTTADNCPVGLVVTNNAPANYTYNKGITNVIWTVTDKSGNKATAIQQITVLDQTNPTAAAPSLVTVNAISNCQIAATSVPYGLVVNDNCGVPTATNDAPDFFPLGYNTITWTVTDGSGNHNSLKQIIHVIDNLAPVFEPLATITVNADTNCSATGVNLGTPSVTDNCSFSIPTNDAPSIFPIGTTIVTWTAIDSNGNIGKATQTVNVVDNTPPAITCASGSPFTRSNSNGLCGYTAVGNEFDAAATDNCTLTLTHNYTSWSNPASLAGATFPVGTTNILWTATDAEGNISTCSTTVVVEDTEAPVLRNCPGNLTLGTYSCVSAPNWNVPTATDNCGTATVVQTAGPLPTDTLATGIYTVAYKATDVAGNTSECSFTITVSGDSAPILVCPQNIVAQNTDSNQCYWTSGSTVNPVQAIGNCPTTITWSITNPDTSTTTGSGDVAGYEFQPGTSVVTYTITDSAAATASSYFTVQVIDAVLPIITAPANIATTTNSGCTATGVDLGTPASSDNCSVESPTNDAPETFPLGTTSVTWTVFDGSGNKATAVQTVTVTDNVAPTITCVGPFTQNSDADLNNYTAKGTEFDVTTVTDNCDVVSFTHNYTQAGNNTSLKGAVFPIGNTTVIWTAKDASGNSSTCTVTISITDNQAPEFFSCPPNMTVGQYAGCSGISWRVPTATDNCSGVVVSQISGPTPNSTFAVGTYTIVYKAIDASNNVATCSFSITVTNSSVPVLVCPSAPTIKTTTPMGCDWISGSNDLTPILAAGNCPTTLSWKIVNPNGSIVSGTNDASGYTFTKGTSTLTYELKDAGGTTVNCSTTVNVSEKIAPTIVAPANILVNANASCSAVIANLGTPITADNCAVASVTNDAPATFPIGATNVVWTVTDTSGNTASATQVVTVIDNTNPTIIAPANMTVNANTSCGAVIATLGNPVTTDNCTVADVTNDAPDTFPLGTKTVIWTVKDAAGNIGTAAQTVTVIDNTLPTITAPADIATTTNTGCTATGLAIGTATTSDNCTVYTVTNNAPSIFPLGKTEITWTVTDGSGNKATAIQTVTVTDNIFPTITAPADLTVNANKSCVAFNVKLNSPVTADNCAVASVTNDAPYVFPSGETIVTWTVTDGSGNKTTAIQTVTVIDTTSPEIFVPAAITVYTDTRSCTATNVVLEKAFAIDNCTVTSITNNAPAAFPLGATNVVWTAEDASGNKSTGIQVVTVFDNVVPTVLTKDITIPLGADGNANITVSQLDNGSYDNCSIATMTLDKTTFTCANVGQNTVTLTVKDVNGNISTETAIVTVQDITAPVALTQNITAELDAKGNAVVTVDQINNGSSDTCGIASLKLDKTSFNCDNVGKNTVTLKVTDINGNVSSQTAIVTIVNNAGDNDSDGLKDNCDDDDDNDGILDTIDKAPLIPNADQLDTDGDGIADVLDTDDDNDGVLDTNDNAPLIPNADQLDTDGDGIGDVLDTDDDNDGVLDTNDNAPLISNADQLDTDGDGIGDVLDTDDDNDGVPDTTDNSPLISNSNQGDRDKDGKPDVEDVIEINISRAITPNGDGINDTWMIYNIENHPNATVRVFNRWGKEVYFSKNYNNDWDGHYASSNNALPESSSYYYQIDLDGDGSKDYDGWLYIKK